MDNTVCYKKELLNINILFPLFYLLLGIILMTIDQAQFSLQSSLEYFQKKPFISFFSIMLFTYYIPRIGFIVNKKSPSAYQKKWIYFLTFIAFFLSIFLLK